MHVCYIDESGTPDVPGNTSHFVLAGISIPVWHWRKADAEISGILKRFDLADKEFHTAWVLRAYPEQSKIPNFESLGWHDRRIAVEKIRNASLLQLQKMPGSTKAYRQLKKNYRHTEAYIHLTRIERTRLAIEIADCVASWGYARLFAECIDKVHYGKRALGVEEQAFEQVVSRFENFLSSSEQPGEKNYGLLVHDNNSTVDLKHTRLMRNFHQTGTLWTRIEHIVDTPLFVNSSLTSMVQIADLCAYSLRRFLENRETDLFRRIFVRGDRALGRVVGVRHFTSMACVCEICQAHRAKP